MRRTKIIATIGPASETVEILSNMIKAGVDVCRLNFSHGTYEHHSKLLKNIRSAAKKNKKSIAVIQDLQGPKIRIGEINEDGLILKSGGSVILVLRDKVKKNKTGHDRILPIPHKALFKSIKKRQIILLRDGLVELEAVEVKKDSIRCRIKKGGKILSNNNLNIPGIKMRSRVITDKDKEDLHWGIKNGVDFVALSFVRCVADVKKLHSLIKKEDSDSRVRVIVKIERPEAVKNFDKILEIADGIMIARGDLGLEIPLERVPLEQKKMIKKCMKKNKSVIVATEMLGSMVENSRPSRAEVSDVANAVIDHTDAVMLSGETALGKYPVESVSYMAKIATEVESSIYDDLPQDWYEKLCDTGERYMQIGEATASTMDELVKNTRSKAIVATSATGRSALILSAERIEIPLIALVYDEIRQRQLMLSWGVYPYLIPKVGTMEKLIDKGIGFLKRKKIIKKGDKIIMATGLPVGGGTGMNVIKVHEVK